MGALVQAGQILVAGTGAGQLNQYYGFSDAAQTTVNGASFGSLSSVYTIPAGEADYADVAYELYCAGFGSQGSTQQQLFFQMFAGSALGSQPFLAASMLSASQAFRWWMRMTLTCSDGVNSWWGSLEGAVTESGSSEDPGVTGQQAAPVADCNTSVHVATVSSAIACSVQAKWGSATGGPTLTCVRTNWKKVA